MTAPEPPTDEEIALELEERVEVDATLEGKIARAVHADALRVAGVKPAAIEAAWPNLHRDLRAPWLRGAAVALDVIVESA